MRLSINEVGVSTINVHCALTAYADERYLDIELSYVAVIGILEFLKVAVLDNYGSLMLVYSIVAEFIFAALMKFLISLSTML